MTERQVVTVSDSCVQREVQLGKAIKNGVVFLVFLCLWILQRSVRTHLVAIVDGAVWRDHGADLDRSFRVQGGTWGWFLVRGALMRRYGDRINFPPLRLYAL